ncbi:DUF4279 domain-containing protein [Paenibacillus sp. Marseille-Q7038]
MRQNKLESKLEVVISIENNEKPAIYLNKETINLLSDLGTEIDIDLYIYS